MDQRFAVLLTSILSALTATAAMYTALAVASANYYRRKREMFMSIITDSSNKISAISQLLKAKKRGARNRRFWQRPMHLVFSDHQFLLLFAKFAE